MQYTQGAEALLTATNKQSGLNIEVRIDDLYEAFCAVQDPRRAQGRVYWLPSLLCLSVGAILCNCLSVLAISEWAEGLSQPMREALRLPQDRSPDQSTLHRLFRRLDPHQLSTALTDYFEQSQSKGAGKAGKVRKRGEQAIAVDGKCRKGQLQYERTCERRGEDEGGKGGGGGGSGGGGESGTCTIHDIEAFSHDIGVVLVQVVLDNQGGEAELSGAPRLLASISWQGRIMTGDALYCHRELCEMVLRGEGDYLVVVKGNQGELYGELTALFEAPEMQSAEAARVGQFDCRVARTIDKGHGRIEQRQGSASTDLAGYSRWPGLSQVVQIRRTWEQKGVTRCATRYLVTSLPPEEASIERLMELRRGHWRIENSLHYVKDVTMGEDRSLIHMGKGGAVMAALRNTALSLLHMAGHKRIASALRSNSQRPHQALSLMGLLNSSDA